MHIPCCIIFRICSLRVAFKILPNANLEQASRTVQPSATGSGLWSWWAETSALNFGTVITTSKITSTSTVADCLKVCNDMSACAGVRFSDIPEPDNFGVSQAAAQPATEPICKLFSGEVVSVGVQSSLIRTRLSAGAGIAPVGV